MTGRKMKEGECFECGERGSLAILCWNRGDYSGYCEKCARKFLRDQYAGSALRHDRPEAYEEYAREYDRPRQHILFNSGGDWLELDVPGGWDE